MRPPAIRIEGLVKEYAAPKGSGRAPLRAVDGLSLTIPGGAFYGLLGPNGAGKTTTIRTVTGLTRRTSGVVEVGGLDVARDFRAARRLIGLAPQDFDFDQFLTTTQVLVYRGLYFEMERSVARRRAAELLERFELSSKADVRVHHLSGGQKRRLLIAKCLMHDPEILILDEPTAGIDVSLRRQLWSYLRELNRDGKTVLLTTHYIEEAETLCDRVGIIDHGRLVAEGTPAELSAASGSDHVHLRLGAPWRGEPAAVARELDLEITVSSDGLEWDVRGGRGGAVASRVLAHLVGAGARVDSLDVRRHRLEDAFVAITGRAIDPSGGAKPVEAA